MGYLIQINIMQIRVNDQIAQILDLFEHNLIILLLYILLNKLLKACENRSSSICMFPLCLLYSTVEQITSNWAGYHTAG